jgi:hypothetical protein
MKKEEAAAAIGYLLGTGTGWNDDAAELYIQNMARLTDVPAALAAVEQIGNTWTERSRPPWSVVLAAYRTVVRRQMMDAPRIEAARGELIGADRGRVIAARNYVKQCHLNQQAPNKAHFDRLAGIADASDDERAAFRAEVFGERPEAVSE